MTKYRRYEKAMFVRQWHRHNLKNQSLKARLLYTKMSFYSHCSINNLVLSVRLFLREQNRKKCWYMQKPIKLLIKWQLRVQHCGGRPPGLRARDSCQMPQVIIANIPFLVLFQFINMLYD